MTVALWVLAGAAYIAVAVGFGFTLGRRLADLTFDAGPIGANGVPQAGSSRHGVANTPSASSPGRDASNPPAAAAGAHSEATA